MFESLLLATTLAATTPDVEALLRSADAPRLAMLNSIVRLRATVELDDQPPQSAEFDLYTGNADQQLVVFRDKRAKGRKFLMVGTRAWLIVPGSQNPVSVTASQRMVGASSFADLARVRLSEDYRGELRPDPAPCGEPARPCHVVDIQATMKSAPYASGTLWIDDNGLLRRAIYKLASGKPAKEIVYQYKTENGRTVPAGLTLTDLLFSSQSGTTRLLYLERRSANHPAALFDPQSHLPARKGP